MNCGFDGVAVIRSVNGEPVWDVAPERIHVSSELLADMFASGRIEQRYDIGPWCADFRAFHATRKDDE
jgi:hypothetical protein